MSTKLWSPEKFLNLSEIKKGLNYALIVLNRPINGEKELVECLWNHAAIRITVDGGTNRWLDFLRKHNLEHKLEQPNLITGDLDSCFKESISFFCNSRVIKTLDQNETDFTKSLRVLEPFIEELNIKHVIALCETSGRMDHQLANINTLFKNHLKSPAVSRPVFILSVNSLSWLLSTGHHKIHIPMFAKKLWCALIPFESTIVSTAGLKWNLNNNTMKFGGIVSTSNKYDSSADFVEVTTDHPLLWSMGISKVDDD